MSNIIHQSNNNVNSNGPKLIFMGTPEFAVPILKKLIDNTYKPVAVFCAPDKPIGRKQILTPPLTKALAQEHNIPIYQPANSHELAQTIKSLSCDIIITAAYGLIFPKEVLDAPQYGCLNIHPSLLPKYRGASPLQATILNGDIETGVTIYKMDAKVDHGPIIIQKKLESSLDQLTTPELSEKLANFSSELLLETLPEWLAGKITPIPQDDSLASHTKIIKKEDGQINWQKSAKKIEQQIRAFTPWPSAHTLLTDYRLPTTAKIKITEAIVTEKNYDKKVGEVFLINTCDLAVQTGSGSLIIKKLQDSSDFLRGHKDIIGTILN